MAFLSAEHPRVETSTQSRLDALRGIAVLDCPGFFSLRARLPVQGRTNAVLAATPRLNAVLKTYAGGGENELHAHTNEDHLFVVLQGAATFRGPRGQERVVGRHGGVIPPSGVVYRFTAHEGEPLVPLRVAAVIDPTSDPLARVDEQGRPFDGYSDANKEVAPVLSPTLWFE